MFHSNIKKNVAILKQTKDNLETWKLQYGIFNNERANVLKEHFYGNPAKHLPKRDILKQPVDLDKNIIKRILGMYIKNTNLSKKDAMFPVLNGFGRYLVDNIIKHFVEQNGRGYLAPLKQSTINKKKNNLILRDTFKMYKAITSKVVKK